MRTFVVTAFDELIAGTSGTWYTPATFNESFGAADGLVLHAVTTSVAGTLPTLTCQVEHSGDARTWVSANPIAEIPQQAIVEGGSLSGVANILSPVLLKFVRVRVSLGGTAPGCRLKVHITGRTSGTSRTAAQGKKRPAAKQS